MPATSFDQHVNEALALLAASRRPVPEARTAARAAGAMPQHGRPRLMLVPRPTFSQGSTR
ncbi:hypothetical protein [Streptomyces sp. NPDC050485]|uniref:hypothetical protein n=1 Tax=Streptomyces sp. NPDC050485 TaxID=3365617 RepID=UPI00379DA749